MENLDISGLETGIPFELFGHQLVLMRSIVLMCIPLLIMLGIAVALHYAVKKQDVRQKPAPLLVLAEALWSFAGGSIEGLEKSKYNGFLHVLATNLFLFLVLINSMGLFGVNPPASSALFAIGLGLFTAILVHTLGITSGVKNYFKDYFAPMIFFFPLNVIDVFSQVISISMRLFGNMLAGVILAELVRLALEASFGTIIGGPMYSVFGAALSLYSDLFIAAVQSLIFMSLTMSYIRGRLNYSTE